MVIFFVKQQPAYGEDINSQNAQFIIDFLSARVPKTQSEPKVYFSLSVLLVNFSKLYGEGINDDFMVRT